MVASVAALLSTLVWALAVVGGLGVLGATGVYVTREVLAYRADRRTPSGCWLQLAARGIPVQPARRRPAPAPAAVTALGTPAAGRVAGVRGEPAPD